MRYQPPIRCQRPTRRQKLIISEFGLKSENYLVIRETDEAMELYSKSTGKTITRYKKEKKS